MTIIYVTARTMESQMSAKAQLDGAWAKSDQSLGRVSLWPGTLEEGQMFKSKYLFAAVLGRHRSLVKVGNYFWDELQFYTNILDIMFGWMHQDIKIQKASDIYPWLISYSYLMGSVNYLGAEQALCSAFNAIICFSHRETFYYANYSFSAEAVFRLYRQSYPVDRGEGWKVIPHQRFFPELYACREEIFADMDYLGMSIDPSLCDFSRKNETRFHETDVLTVTENSLLLDAVTGQLQGDVDKAAFEFLFSGIILGTLICYVTLLHIVRCTCIKCIQARTARRWRLKEAEIEEDKMDHMTLHHQTKMVKYEEYNNFKPNAIKVATV